MRIVETAWVANPHPDLADAYAHVRLGDSARQRLVRVETLAQKAPGHVEGVLAVARAAIDASEFARAREVLAPLLDAPTQRVALLMAELERLEHGDSGRTRAWTLRAVRALHDPAWTADGYVSDRWRPVSPVTGRLDAFQWLTPVAALPSDKTVTMESKAFNEAMLEPRRVAPPAAEPVAAEPSQPVPAEPKPAEPAPAPAAQDNSPVAATAAAALPAATSAAPAAAVTTAPVVASAPPVESPPATPPPPLFRPRSDLGKAAPGITPIVPIVRAPDDPGIDEDPVADEFAERMSPGQGQAGGWRGFLARWGG
jgi:HemY protein